MKATKTNVAIGNPTLTGRSDDKLMIANPANPATIVHKKRRF